MALAVGIGVCKIDVTPLLTHWNYVFLALTVTTTASATNDDKVGIMTTFGLQVLNFPFHSPKLFDICVLQQVTPTMELSWLQLQPRRSGDPTNLVISDARLMRMREIGCRIALILASLHAGVIVLR